MSRRFSLRTIYLATLTVVFLAAFAAFVAFDYNSQQEQAEEALLEEARVFAREMDAVWEFMDNSQYTINTSKSGDYDFKGLHCAIVGKSVGAIFSAGSDYAIRYTNIDPRGYQNQPDSFETAALETFYSGQDVWEYYGYAEYNGETRFRYLRALEVDPSCLPCHGEPAGEIDITKRAKEGWRVGDPGGAISIVIPLDKQNEIIGSNLVRDAVFFLLLTLLIGMVVFGATYWFVLRPLDRMKPAFEAAGEGELRVQVDDRHAASEISDIIKRFNGMASELDALYAGLERQVADRTSKLEEALHILENQRDELEKLSEQLARDSEFKSDLLAMVNHELRTPLTAIISCAQMARDAKGFSEEENARAWEDVEKGGKVLLEMIGNMLDMARVDAGNVAVVEETFEIGDLIADVYEAMLPLASRSNVALCTDVSSEVSFVTCDYDKMLRILENLVGNAVKFTPDGGSVTISVLREAESGDVLVSVADTGIGIAPEDQGRIFERFVQVDGTMTRKYGGNGLGLALVKNYVELQNLALELGSEPGKGSTFTVRIPASAVGCA